jgi:hypothetical protein
MASPHPADPTHCIHPKKFKSRQDQTLFIYGEKLKKRRLKTVHLTSRKRVWNVVSINDTTNEYVDLTVNPELPTASSGGSYGDDDLTITLEFDDGTLTDPTTLGDLYVDDT